MKDINKVILVGRLGADPIQRETKNAVPVVHFPLATSRKIQTNAEGVETMSQETQWHRIVVWGKEAENCAQFLKKGAAVYVEGFVRSHKYDGKDGAQRIAFEIHAEDVSFLGNPKPKTLDSPEWMALAQ